MTEILVMNPRAIPPSPAPVASRLNPFFLWSSTITVFFHPRQVAPQWTYVSLRAAIPIALVNVLLIIPWAYFVIASYISLDRSLLRTAYRGPWVADPVAAFSKAFTGITPQITKVLSELDTLSRIGTIASVALAVVSVLTIAFFILLPFAARPGSTRAALRHTARSTLLLTGAVHLWGSLASLTLLILIWQKNLSGPENVAPPLLFLFAGLCLFTLAIGIITTRFDYRPPLEHPSPRPPTCEKCGYDLRMTPLQGRCSECGTPVLDSLDPLSRPLSPWEKHPSLAHPKVIFAHAKMLITSPRTLFYAMPIRTGHWAAQYWLLLSATLVGLLASLIVPAFWLIGLFEDWSWAFVAGGIAMGTLWAGMAMMMVGIETLGLVTYGRIHRRPIELAAAAKTTCYASFLMFLWVLLGGIQLLALAAWFHYSSVSKGYISSSLVQGITVGSFAIAHIGGILWYEITVYRGARAIQWANR